MSTYALRFSRPRPNFQVVKSIAAKAFTAFRGWVARVSPRTVQTRTLVHDAATWTLSIIASSTGYDIVMNTGRLVTENMYAGLVAVCRYGTRAFGYATRATYTLIALVNAGWARTVEDTVERFIAEPILNTALTTDARIRAFGEHLWVQAHDGRVIHVTMSTARTFTGLIGINTLTGAVIAEAPQV